MLSFASDYIAGAHEEILKRLEETNRENLTGYGTDIYCQSAAQKIKDACGLKDGEVYFLVGGTQTNQIVISTMLEPYQGVIAASTGHINVHEAGAIEYSGHKVIELGHELGKLDASDIDQYCSTFYQDESFEHMVFPGMVYISYPTEYGTLYTKEEIKAIYEVCKEYKMILFIDGARLGYGLESYKSDITLKELASLCDVFYIGGTKVGALCGEAVVFTKNNAPNHFIAQIKQHGGLLAKGRLLGVQFDTLFTNDLYFKISKYAIDLAEKLKEVFIKKGYPFFIDSPTNQQFVIMNKYRVDELRKNVVFECWEKFDENNMVVRFVTSWSTTEKDIEELEKLL